MNSNNFDALIVLSNHMNKNGDLNSESRLRADKAAEIYKQNNESKIITCGWAYRADSQIKISEAMKSYLVNFHDIPSNDILLEPKSRDTVGDAVFTRKFIEDKFNFSKLAIITSFFHLNRAKYIFKFIYDKKFQLSFFTSDSINEDQKKDLELESLEKFKKTFYGIKKGELSSIYKRMMDKHPLYNNQLYNSKNQFSGTN